MPVSLKKMAANTATLTIQVEEDTAKIVYYPGRVTENILAQFDGLGDLTEDTAMAGFATFNGQIAELIKSWDVYEDEEETRLLPVTSAGISKLPFSFRIQLIEAIIGDVRPEYIAPQKILSPVN